MLFATDENFDGRILKGLRERLPEADIIRIQDTEMYQASDPELLQWLAEEGRVLLTHDVRTMPRYVYDRVREGQPVPGVVEIHHKTSIGIAIDELEIIVGAGEPDDFKNQVKFIPLR